MKRIIVSIATGDKHYFNLARGFLVSLTKNSAYSDAVELNLINGTRKQAQSLEKLCVNTKVNLVDMWKPSPVDIVFSRLTQWRRILDEGYDQMASIDSDSIIRGSLEGLWRDVEPGCFKIWDKGKKKKEKVRFQTGVFVVGVSRETLQYFDHIIKSIAKPSWIKIQKAFYLSYIKNKENVKHVQLDTKYNDQYFNDDSIIWHCKQTRYGYPKFKGELRKYLRLADEREEV
jgi:hypothetical protein